MDKGVVVTGYQRIDMMNFKELTNTRKLKPTSTLVFLFLRGLYCRFGKPEFYCKDSIIRDYLTISKNTLKASKQELMEKGLIRVTKGVGRKSSSYEMLETFKSRGSEIAPLRVNNCDKGVKTCPSLYKSKERVINKKGDFLNFASKSKSRWNAEPVGIKELLADLEVN